MKDNLILLSRKIPLITSKDLQTDIYSFNTNCTGYLKMLYNRYKYLRYRYLKKQCVCVIYYSQTYYLVMFFQLTCAFTNSVPCRQPVSSWSTKVKLLQNLKSSLTLKPDFPPFLIVFSFFQFTVPVGQFCESTWASPPSCDPSQTIDWKSSWLRLS